MDGPENLMGYQPWRPARDIIDWSIPGTSIFDRKKPLADATIRRIAAGIEKYWKDYAKPFLAVLYGTSTVESLDFPLSAVTTSGAHHALVEPFVTAIGQNSAVDRSRSLDEPLSTIVGKQEHCLIEPFITRYQGSHEGEVDGDNRNHGITRPLPTVDTSNRYGIVEPLLVEYHGTSTPYSVSLPVKTITTKDRFALLEPLLTDFRFSNKPYPASNPLGTIVTKSHIGLLEPSVNPRLDIRFRMLKNHELKKAQGFPDDYKITGNITEQTKQIGQR
jgi:DNA (cytosine-5)-methyltransferase 1